MSVGRELAVPNERRERVIDVLSDHFSEGRLELDEFERRVELAHDVESLDELGALIADLEPTSEASEEPKALIKTASISIVPAEVVPETSTVAAVLGSTMRSGEWTVPRKMTAIGVLGSVELDFRDAQMAAGVSEVSVVSVLGDVKILAPPELRVQVEGIGVLGDFKQTDCISAPADAPVLRVTGVALLGDVKVRERLPGESGMQSWRRRRKERKRRKQLAAKARE